MFRIQVNNYKVIITRIKKNFFELKRITKNTIITIYARRDNLNNKINQLMQPLKEIEKELNF